MRVAQESVLKVRGTNRCGRGVEGTGFLYAEDRLITNAHVVAGVDDPEVLLGDGVGPRRRSCSTTPRLDLAVLRVRRAGPVGAPLRPRAPRRGDPVVILGYPQDGPYDATGRPDPGRAAAALTRHLRPRHRSSARSSPCAASIRPGNSGGPIVERDGDVVGVVFAASVTDQDTGYAPHRRPGREGGGRAG